MKKLFIALLAVAASQAVASADEWVGIGTGAYQPGLLDYYSDEYPDLLEAAVYESSEREGVYRFVPSSPGGNSPVPYDVVVHTADPERVWCETASFFRGIMNYTVTQKVNEASSDYNNDANYGKMADGVISFATPNSFYISEMMGRRDTNLNGRFALYMPGEAPGGEPCANDTWQVMGTGRYVEGLLDIECRPGRNWAIEVEQSVEHPSCYRFKPYKAGNPSFPNTPELADTYIYVHAENDMEVYTSDFVLLNSQGVGYKVMHRARIPSEEEPAYYGMLEDGIITFPANSHYVEYVGISGMPRMLTNTSGQACIALPGADFKDYYLDAELGICATGDDKGFCKFKVTITGGADVAGAMLVVEPGVPEITDAKILEYATNSGNSVFPAMFFGFEMSPYFPMVADQFNTNRWTVILIALDQNSQPHGYIVRTFFTPEDNDNWEDYAKGEFTDLILGPSYAAYNETHTVDIQRKKGTEGMLRVVNPYADHSKYNTNGYNAGHTDHSHYLYINANDPEYVYIEESAAGFNFGYGDVVLTSAIGSQLNHGRSLDEIKAMGTAAGRFADNVVTFPANSLFFFETKFRNGMLQPGDEGTLLRITEYTNGIADVSVDNAPAVYYDLRGQKTANPIPGQIYIRVTGNDTSKMVFKE